MGVIPSSVYGLLSWQFGTRSPWCQQLLVFERFVRLFSLFFEGNVLVHFILFISLFSVPKSGGVFLHRINYFPLLYFIFQPNEVY